jgi:hypothetical protein
MDFLFYLREQIELHPSMQPQDAVKLCFQAAFGAEHLLLDIESAREYFNEEYASVEPNHSQPLFERISQTYCRANLSAWKACGKPQGELFEMFRKTAEKQSDSNANINFTGYINSVESMALSNKTPFNINDWRAYMDGYDVSSPKPVRHSAVYRDNELPSYRVLSKIHACHLLYLFHPNT